MNKKLLIAFSFWFLSFTLPPSLLHADILDSFVFPECCYSLTWDNGTLWCSTSSQIMYNMDTTGQIISSFKHQVGTKFRSKVTFDGTYFWVSDDFNDQIVKMDSSGLKLFSFEYRSIVGGITYDGEYLWIIASERYQIDKVDTSGNIIDTIRTPGYHAQSITFDGEYLWVGDYPNIYKMDLSGNVVFVLYYPEGSQQGLAYDGKYLWANVCTDNESRINKLEPDRQSGTHEHFRWAFHADGVESSPAIGSDGTIYAGAGNEYFCAINPDGTLKWKFKTGSVNVIASPAIGSDGTIYINASGRYLYALNPEGEMKWSYEFPPNFLSSHDCLAIGADGTLYVTLSAIGDEYRLFAFNPDGTLKWGARGPEFVGLAIGADGTVYSGTSEGYVYAIDPEGSVKWRVQTAGTLNYPPAIGADGTIYVVSAARLYAISPCGWIKWRLKHSRYISPPAIGEDGTIYTGSEDILYAVNPDGTEKWSVKVGGGLSSIPAIGKDGTIFAAISIAFMEMNLTAITR